MLRRFQYFDVHSSLKGFIDAWISTTEAVRYMHDTMMQGPWEILKADRLVTGCYVNSPPSVYCTVSLSEGR